MCVCVCKHTHTHTHTYKTRTHTRTHTHAQHARYWETAGTDESHIRPWLLSLKAVYTRWSVFFPSEPSTRTRAHAHTYAHCLTQVHT